MWNLKCGGGNFRSILGNAYNCFALLKTFALYMGTFYVSDLSLCIIMPQFSICLISFYHHQALVFCVWAQGIVKPKFSLCLTSVYHQASIICVSGLEVSLRFSVLCVWSHVIDKAPFSVWLTSRFRRASILCMSDFKVSPSLNFLCAWLRGLTRLQCCVCLTSKYHQVSIFCVSDLNRYLVKPQFSCVTLGYC